MRKDTAVGVGDQVTLRLLEPVHSLFGRPKIKPGFLP